MRRKGIGIIVGAIMIGGLFLFLILSVLVFVFNLKLYISQTIIDVYQYNKAQEVPLNLLSMDVKDESFVYSFNKVYYDFADEETLRDETKGILARQIFYEFGTGTKPPFALSVSIEDKEMAEVLYSEETGCYCGFTIDPSTLAILKKCLGPCPRQGFFPPIYGVGVQFYCKTNEDCYGITLEKTVYSSSYPFPLTFNGSKFTGELTYVAIARAIEERPECPGRRCVVIG